VHEPPLSLLDQVPGLRPSVEAVLLRALAKNKDERFATVDAFVTALECATTDAVLPVLGAPRAVNLADTPDAKLSPPTTLSRTSGELTGDNVGAAVGSRKALWMAAVGMAAAGSLAAVLFLRPGPTSKPALVAPATTPAQPVAPPPAPPPPTPDPAMVPGPKETPSKVEPAAATEEFEAEPKAPGSGSSPRPKAKKPKSGRDSKSGGVPAASVPSLPKKAIPAKKSEEGEDKWRLD
jgi:hypothetical protein